MQVLAVLVEKDLDKKLSWLLAPDTRLMALLISMLQGSTQKELNRTIKALLVFLPPVVAQYPELVEPYLDDFMPVFLNVVNQCADNSCYVYVGCTLLFRTAGNGSELHVLKVSKWFCFRTQEN